MQIADYQQAITLKPIGQICPGPETGLMIFSIGSNQKIPCSMIDLLGNQLSTMKNERLLNFTRTFEITSEPCGTCPVREALIEALAEHLNDLGLIPDYPEDVDQV